MVMVVVELAPTKVIVEAPAVVLTVLGFTGLLNVTAKVSLTPITPTVLPVALVLVILDTTNVATVVFEKAELATLVQFVPTFALTL
jgi:hypothetical protein